MLPETEVAGVALELLDERLIPLALVGAGVSGSAFE